jgi:hypothetical protein
MTEYGFTVIDAVKTVFAYERGQHHLLVATVVDDSIVAFNNKRLYNEFKEFLMRNLPITECPLDTICGMRVIRNADASISIDQQEYIEKKASMYGCDTEGSKIWSPMCTQFKLDSRPEMPDPKMISYAREIMGSLIFATLTHPECKYACSKLSTVVTNPTEKDLRAMERVLQYLYNSRNTKLTYRA